MSPARDIDRIAHDVTGLVSDHIAQGRIAAVALADRLVSHQVAFGQVLDDDDSVRHGMGSTELETVRQDVPHRPPVSHGPITSSRIEIRIELSREGVKYGLGVQKGVPGNFHSTPGKMTLKVSLAKVVGKLLQCVIEPRKQKSVVWYTEAWFGPATLG